MTWRGYLRLVAAALLLLIHLPLWAIARLFGREQQVVRSFLGGIGWLLGLRVAIAGVPMRGAVLLAGNHISWLDILALGGALPCRFIAKAEIARWPLVGWLARIGRLTASGGSRRASAARGSSGSAWP